MIYIASDHAGIDLKNELMKARPQFQWKDFGCFDKSSVDYPDYADLVCHEVPEAWSSENFGVLVCGSGQGMVIRANRYSHIRAALCWCKEITELARSHNDANVLCLPGRFISTEEALDCFDLFQKTSFSDGRHSQRVAKLSKALNTPK